MSQENPYHLLPPWQYAKHHQTNCAAPPWTRRQVADDACLDINFFLFIHSTLLSLYGFMVKILSYVVAYVSSFADCSAKDDLPGPFRDSPAPRIEAVATERAPPVVFRGSGLHLGRRVEDNATFGFSPVADARCRPPLFSSIYLLFTFLHLSTIEIRVTHQGHESPFR